MSTEQPRLRWFTGLDDLEDLVSGTGLKVIPSDPTSAKTLEPGEFIRLSPDDASRCGLRLRMPDDAEAVTKAVAATGLPAEAVKVVVIAEDTFLKERCFVLGPVDPVALTGEHVLASLGGTRVRALQNPFAGFELRLVYVLDRDLDHGIARRPHRKGTILAKSVWQVKGQRDIGGLTPQPLDQKTREDAKLPPGTVLFLKVDGDLLVADDLDALTVYVHEGLYNRLASARGAERTLILQQLSIDAVIQLAFLMSKQMDATFEWDGQHGAALRLLNRLVRELTPARHHLVAKDFARKLHSEPEWVGAVLSGTRRQAVKLIRLFEDPDNAEEQ
jgi:hypothetical protein